MNESASIERTSIESKRMKDARTWLPWLGILLLLIGAGVAAWNAFVPDYHQRLVVVEVADPNSLLQGKAGVQNRIPIRITNRSDHPIRMVGNNAC